MNREQRLPQTSVVVGICILLAGLIWFSFGQTLKHDFVNYDDNSYVYENADISQGLSFAGCAWAFTHVHAANWHPLTTISHMLDCQLYGLKPGGHHFSNVLFHTIAAILLFLALWELTDGLWISAFTAAIFAIHPLRVESVAWIAERKDVLSGVFFMLTLWAYARYARDENRSLGRYTLVLVFFALGLLCKPTLVTLPLVLLLLDYWPLRRFTKDRLSSLKHLVLEKLPLLALSVASCVATLLAQKEALKTFEKLPLAERLANALVSYVVYLGQAFYPTKLAVFYPQLGTVSSWNAIAAFFVLLAISALCCRWRRRYPFLVVGWLWFLGMLVPMIGLVQVGWQAHADRYTYLAQIGLYLAIAYSAAGLRNFPHGKVAMASAAVVILILLVVDTRVQASYWRDSEALWRHAIAVTKDNYVAYNNLGTTFRLKGDNQTALELYRKSIEINPDYGEVEGNIGLTLLVEGKPEEAIAHFEKGVQSRPELGALRNNFGNALLKLGRRKEAIEQYERALKRSADFSLVHNNLGNALREEGELDKAIAEFRRAIEIRSGEAQFHQNLADALLQKGSWQEAIASYEQALRLKPDYVEAHVNMAYALRQTHRNEEAFRHVVRAMELRPNEAKAHFNVAIALREQEQVQGAIDQYRQAAQLDPQAMPPRNNLAWLLATYPSPLFRDGAEALRLAKTVADESGGRDPGVLDTLAAAYAEAGDFPAATETATRALELAKAANDTKLAEQIEQRLELYRKKQPYRQP